jgi:hypothetical protein
MRVLLLLAVTILVPAISYAQLGAAVHFRSVNGAQTDAADSERRGLAGRLFYDFTPARAFGWRLDAAFGQTSYDRGTLYVSENSVEASALGRLDARDGALTGAYVMAGPVASFRVNCGVSGGYVDCGANPSQQAGYTIGVGYRSPITERRQMVFEVSFSDRVVGSGGAPFVSIGFGLQSRRTSARD